MTEFAQQYPKFTEVYGVAAHIRDTRPMLSRVVIEGLTRLLETDGFSEEEISDAFVQADAALLICEAQEICDER